MKPSKERERIQARRTLRTLACGMLLGVLLTFVCLLTLAHSIVCAWNVRACSVSWQNLPRFIGAISPVSLPPSSADADARWVGAEPALCEPRNTTRNEWVVLLSSQKSGSAWLQKLLGHNPYPGQSIVMGGEALMRLSELCAAETAGALRPAAAGGSCSWGAIRTK